MVDSTNLPEIDINAIVTDLNNKMDRDNLNASDTGTAVGGGWSFPSDTYINLTLQASGSTYTAPANGWFSLDTWTNPSGGISYLHLALVNVPLGSLQVPNQASGYQQRMYIPAKKGDICVFYYNNIDTSRTYLRFIYAVVSEPQN